MQLNYHEFISYMKELRAFFNKEHNPNFNLGKIYQGNPDFSYFSLTTAALKKRKLKFVIILDLKILSFSICLSGQNKSIRKTYWEMFKQRHLNKFPIAKSIDDSLAIINHRIVKKPDFNNKKKLTKQIEKESIKFINELIEILE